MKNKRIWMVIKYPKYKDSFPTGVDLCSTRKLARERMKFHILDCPRSKFIIQSTLVDGISSFEYKD